MEKTKQNTLRKGEKKNLRHISKKRHEIVMGTAHGICMGATLERRAQARQMKWDRHQPCITNQAAARQSGAT